MARSVNLILSCVALLGAALLAYVLTPHRLMARTHEVFDIDSHIPRNFGEWSPLPGVQAIKPPPDGLEAQVYNQEVARVLVDKERTRAIVVTLPALPQLARPRRYGCRRVP